MASEAEIQAWVADYLRLQYPKVLFHSDFGSGIKLTPGQAAKQKRQNGGRRAWPDMFIAQPKIHRTKDNQIFGVEYYGMFLELKKEGTRLMKKDGTWASEHIAEQAEVLDRLSKNGYYAKFAVGFDEAKELIERYLGEPNE